MNASYEGPFSSRDGKCEINVRQFSPNSRHAALGFISANKYLSYGARHDSYILTRLRDLGNNNKRTYISIRTSLIHYVVLYLITFFVNSQLSPVDKLRRPFYSLGGGGGGGDNNPFSAPRDAMQWIETASEKPREREREREGAKEMTAIKETRFTLPSLCPSLTRSALGRA